MYQLNLPFPHGFSERQDETEARVMLSRAVECVPHSARGLTWRAFSPQLGELQKKYSQKDILGEICFKDFFRDSTILLLLD